MHTNWRKTIPIIDTKALIVKIKEPNINKISFNLQLNMLNIFQNHFLKRQHTTNYRLKTQYLRTTDMTITDVWRLDPWKTQWIYIDTNLSIKNKTNNNLW